MAISVMFPALTSITSSIVSPANYSGFFSRVLSIAGSFSDQASLLQNAAASPSASASPLQARDDPLPLTAGGSPAAFDVEVAIADHGGDDDAQQGAHEDEVAADEAKRVSKIVQTVCVFAASASIAMFVNLPEKAAAPRRRTALYSITLAFIYLGLLTSMFLSMFSILARARDTAVATMQKRAMVMAITFVLISFTLLMCMTSLD
ncbi:hypothetical protein ABZP36_015201 [Zizania latifolia]